MHEMEKGKHSACQDSASAKIWVNLDLTIILIGSGFTQGSLINPCFKPSLEYDIN